MIEEENVQHVKDFFAALGRGDMPSLLALSAEDIEWIIPGRGWQLAGTRRGHAGMTELLQIHSDTVNTTFLEAREIGRARCRQVCG